jgi:hypothetical protein
MSLVLRRCRWQNGRQQENPMTLVRAVLALALMLPAVAQADGVYDTHFNRGSCYLRNYTPHELAEHPDQRVRSIWLAPVPIEEPKGTKIFNLMVNLRGSDDYATCRAKGKTMACALDNGGGKFTLKASGINLLLSIAKTDVVLHGAQGSVRISGTQGDDRVFLLASVSPALCN